MTLNNKDRLVRGQAGGQIRPSNSAGQVSGEQATAVRRPTDGEV